MSEYPIMTDICKSPTDFDMTGGERNCPIPTGSVGMVMKSIEVIDHAATGYWHAHMRKESGVSLRELARRMGISAAYLSDLEHGKRNWSEKLSDRYENSLSQNTD